MPNDDRKKARNTKRDSLVSTGEWKYQAMRGAEKKRMT